MDSNSDIIMAVKKNKGYLVSKEKPRPSKMEEIIWKDYEEFIKNHNYVIIEDTQLEIGKKWKIKEYQPKNFELEATTVWSFPTRR